MPNNRSLYVGKYTTGFNDGMPIESDVYFIASNHQRAFEMFS